MKLMLTLGCVAAVAVSHASLFDNTATKTGFINPSGGVAPAMRVTNTNAYDVSLTSVAFYGLPGQADTYKFFITDANYTVLNSVSQVEDPTGGTQLYGTFVNWNLKAGATYFIGAITPNISTPQNNYYYGSAFPTQNGLQSGANVVFYNFNSPTFSGPGSHDMTWVLNGNAVPEPASMMALGLGVAAFLRKRKK